ncbi:DUF58 domain-containing protein [Fodinicola feengrottensis]|uniref:DUF58 domain-containing protein n=1 Tax=Fodinicola feengrottensis TaxID=435914 RepID=UPI002441FA35|nr:DUF58 domain-containing protein [Fodinicola feengrottensis]
MTARGIGLPLAAVALLVAGLVFGYSDLAVLGTAGLIAAIGSVVWVASRPPLRVQRRVEPARVARGQECLGVVQIRNGSRWRSAALVGEDHCAGRDFEADQPLQPIRLSPREEITTTYQVPTRRRGIVDVGPLRIARRDPLGLVRLAWPYGKAARVWVHPRVYPLLHVPVGTNRSLDGIVDKVQHGSITFHALREYVAGDDLRHVHWRTSAHIGQLMVRERARGHQPAADRGGAGRPAGGIRRGRLRGRRRRGRFSGDRGRWQRPHRRPAPGQRGADRGRAGHWRTTAAGLVGRGQAGGRYAVRVGFAAAQAPPPGGTPRFC